MCKKLSKLYNQSSLKLFWLGSPNQLFVSYSFINAVIFTVKNLCLVYLVVQITKQVFAARITVLEYK